MLVRARVIASSSDARTIAVEWGGEREDHQLVVRGNFVRWPSAPDDDSSLESVIQHVRARTPQPGDSVRLGRALFDALLGESVWSKIVAAGAQADHLELRLQWPANDQVMNDQHWELLHDGARFLATGTRRVAIVREIQVPERDDATIWDAIAGRPTRVMFAVGSELHDAAIRPAAEFLALLRELGRSSDQLPRVRFIEKASVERLAVAIADFEPDVVHLAAHGGAPSSGAFVELRADDGDGTSQVSADQLMTALNAGASAPMVVLSACTTGRVSQQPVGLGLAIAPLAAQLVAAGIPAVVGMSGEVTDRTCRLFARRFGSSLVNGAPLALATSDARRAAFQNQDGNPPDTSVDWALPSLFVPSDMPPSFAPVDASGGTTVRQRIESIYGIALQSRHRPVFAGRLHHIEVFTQVLARTEPCSLLLHGPPGVGVNRLRDELAIFGICEGALLVRVPLCADAYPQNYGAALMSVLLETRTTRRAYGLDSVRSGGGVEDHVAASKLGRDVARVLGDVTVYDDVVKDEIDFVEWMQRVHSAQPEQFSGFEAPLTNALLSDLAAMRNEIAAASDDPVGPVLLDLPELDKWGSATSTVFDRLLRSELVLPGVDGDARVRVLATHRDTPTEADGPGRVLREHAGPRVEVLSVEAFTREEERIAIPWVLLHPWGNWNEVIVPQRTNAEDEWYEKYRALTDRLTELVTQVQGTPPSPPPVYFMHKAFATAINLLRDERHLISDEYSDADLLLGLGQAR